MTDSDNHCQVDKGEKIHMDNENPYVNRNEHSVNDLMHMVVNSEEEAYNLYNEYAARIGFSIRRGNTRYHVGTRNISQKEYYCSCQGFSLEPNCPTRYRNRFETRTGCEAMVRFSVKDGIWKVTKFLKSHNHELASQKEIHLLRSNRILTTPKANVIDSMVNASIITKNDYPCLSREVGGRDHIGFTKRACYNCLNNEKMILIEAGDCQGVVNHFKVRQNQDAMFFHTIQVDQENRMTNFFWRDGRSRIDYDFFGDVVVFDTTYRTNKYDLICAPFVGVNHHWQNIMFGCAFLLDETTTSSFVWLFKSFLESMGGKEPKTIITDENQEMANAIGEVFRNTRHLLCQWHIAKNAPSHLGKFNSDPKFCKIFYKCLQECETEVEFQETWNKMMDEFSELKNHKWLNKLYEIRKSWCLAFNKDVFCGGIRSSQRIKSRSHILNGIASKTTSLSQFVLSFEDLVAGWRYDERAEDFNCEKGMPPRAIQNSGLLHHAAQIFTAKIFFLFKKELLDGIATNWSEISCCDGVHSFKVMEENENSRISTVYFDVLNMDISCTCKKFECMGLLCSHALKICVIKNVTRIPEKYILSRWTKNAKKIIIETEEVLHRDNFGDAETVFRNNVMLYAYDIIVRSQGKESTRHICREALRKLDGDISKELGRLHLHENDEMKENDVNEKEPEEANPMLNPPKSKPKGVSNARLKGHFDERGKKKIKGGSTSEEVNCTSYVEAAHVGEKPHQLFSPSSTPMVPDHVIQHHLKQSDSMSKQIQMPNQLVISCPSRTNAFSSEVPMSTAMHPLSMPFQESSANISKRF